MRPVLASLVAVCAAAGTLAIPNAVIAAEPCDRYAAPTGSDAAAGTAADPLRTVPQLVASLEAGDTGCLRAGSYTETHNGYIARFGRSGSAGAPITLRSHPGERARIVGTVMVATEADHVRITDLDIEGTGDANTVKIYSSDVVVTGNDITNAMRGDSCMILGSSSAGRAVRTIVRRNTFHDCGSPANGNKDHSIYASVTQDVQIVDNVFSNASALTIQLYPDAQDSRVAHNVIDGGAGTIRGGIVIGGGEQTASSGNVVERNVIAHTAASSVYSHWEGPVGTGNVVRSNCAWDAGGTAFETGDGGFSVSGNRVANPRFADRAGRVYRLGAGSDCLGLVGHDTAARLMGELITGDQASSTGNGTGGALAEVGRRSFSQSGCGSRRGGRRCRSAVRARHARAHRRR